MVQLFYDLGVRRIHLAYNRNNGIGGRCYDDDVTLSALGRHIVSAVDAAGSADGLLAHRLPHRIDIMVLPRRR